VPQYRGYKIELMHEAPVGRLPCILCGPIFPFLGSFRFVRNPFLKEPRSRKRNVESIVCLHVKKEGSE
jgi:hypothetical protein